MANETWFSLLILILSCQIISNNEECLPQDRIEDCNCRVSEINQLNNQHLYPLLQEIINKNYFRFYPVNLQKKCQFWSDDSQCSRRTCAIQPCSMENLPELFREKSPQCSNSSLGLINTNISEEHKQAIENWMKFDDKRSENFCDIDDETSIDLEYIDLLINPERYTGYTGSSTQRVWSAIYNENCFFLPDSKAYYNLRQKRLNTDKMCLEGRTFYRLISGLHTSITVHLCAQYFFPTFSGGYSGTDGYWGANIDEFQRRYDPKMTDNESSQWLKNIYFIYLIELRAIYKAREFFQDHIYFTGNETDDIHTKDLIINKLLKEIQPFGNNFNETNLFQNENNLIKNEFKQHFRNITYIMDCVGCDKCKLWGKLQIQALGTSLKILFSEESIQLQRSEIVSLINGFNRLSTSIYHLEHTFKKTLNSFSVI